jgi:hypothetical protein
MAGRGGEPDTGQGCWAWNRNGADGTTSVEAGGVSQGRVRKLVVLEDVMLRRRGAGVQKRSRNPWVRQGVLLALTLGHACDHVRDSRLTYVLRV